MIPKYTPSANKAKGKLLKYRNDIIIYTEDKITDKEFYRMILTRLIDQSIKLNDVIPLGPKTEVIKACVIDKSSDNILYIVDGDLDLINNSNETHEKLFVLDSYCIENFLVCEEAIVNAAWNYGNISIDDLEKLLTFEDFIASTSEYLIDLFLHFALAKHIFSIRNFIGNSTKWPGYAPVIKNIHAFIDQKTNDIAIPKVEKYKEDIKNNIIIMLNDFGFTNPESQYLLLIERKRKDWINNIHTLLRIVSGKDYLLPLVQYRIKKVLGRSAMIESSVMKRMLAAKCDLTRLKDLKLRIEEICFK